MNVHILYIHTNIFNIILLKDTNILYSISDKDLVPEPPDQVEEEVHQRPRAARPAVLQLPRQHGAQAHGPRGQAMVSCFFSYLLMETCRYLESLYN